MNKRFVSLLVLSAPFIFSINAQTNPDLALLAEINRIKAVDNHAHAMSVAGVDGKEDEEYDAIACGKLEFISPPPMRLRPDNPIYAGAWRELYGYKHGDSTSELHLRELLESKRRVMREQGDNYPAWVLDKLNIETMLTNRIARGRGLAAPRFRWVAYGDPLLLPLSTKTLRGQNLIVVSSTARKRCCSSATSSR